MPYLDIWRHPNENFISSRWSSNAATFSFYDATGSNKLAYWVYFLPIWSLGPLADTLKMFDHKVSDIRRWLAVPFPQQIFKSCVLIRR